MLLRRALRISSKRSWLTNSTHSLSLFRFSSSNKNHYQTLGVSQNASDDEIKAAYYKLAKEYHPDVNKNNEEKFKEINVAHDVLSDSNKKREYDDMLRYGGFGSDTPFSEQNQSAGFDGSDMRAQELYEQFMKFMRDNPNNYQGFHQDPNSPFMKGREFKNEQEREEFEKRLQEEFRKAEEEFMREAAKGFENLAVLKKQLIRRALLGFGFFFLSSYLLISLIISLFSSEKYEVYDPNSNTVYVTDDRQFAEAVQNQTTMNHSYQNYNGQAPHTDSNSQSRGFNQI